MKHDDVIACALQILDHLPGGNLEDSRYILTDDATRAQFSDNPEHLRPEVTIVFFSLLLSSHGKWLAGKSTGYNVNCPSTCSLIKTLLRQSPDVAPARHTRPVLFQHFCWVICKFALPNGCKSCPFRSKINSETSAKLAMEEVLNKVGLKSSQDLAYLIGTGYGRNKVPFADENISEISCHAMGVHVTNPEVRAIIDIGGQDVKGISIDTDGTVKSFAMNDKCSAGTGRFFEAMARSFEMSLPEFSNLSLSAKNVIPITAQCTVFAESEVITLVGEGKPTDEIAAGIEMAVAKRCFVMAKKAGATDSITLTGGCAKNAGLKQAIEHVLKFKVVDLKTDPQLMGALGAAEYARQKGLAKK